MPTYDVTGTTEISKGTLQAAATYESTPAGLTMNLAKDSYFNKVSPSGTVSSSYSNISSDASAGYVEPDGSQNTELTVSVKGPFKATMLCGANSSSDKTDRYAYIKVDGAEVAAPNKSSTTLSATGEKLTYSYTGTDTVTVAFGSTKIVRIFDIIIETENGDAAGKVAGEVISMANFTSQTKSVTNDAATLGFVAVGTPTSSDSAVATAEISGGNVVITSKKAGDATITVSDGTNSTTIAVTVGGTGAITATPTKWTSGNGSSVYTVKASSQTPTVANETDTDSNKKLTKNRAIAFETSTGAPSGVTAFCGISNKIESSGFNLGGYLQIAKNYILVKGLKADDVLTVKFKTKTLGTAVTPVLAPDGKTSNPVASAGATTAAYDGVIISDKSDSTKTETEAKFTIPSDGDYIFGTNNGGYITEFSITR